MRGAPGWSMRIGQLITWLVRVTDTCSTVSASVEHQAVRPRHAAEDPVGLAGAAQPIDRPARIVIAALALVGDVEVAVRREGKIVQALEAPLVAAVGHQRARAGVRIEAQDSVLVVGDEDASIAVDLQAVRNAFILGEHGPTAIRRDAEDAPVREVDAVEIAGAIERWPFEEGMQRSGAAPLHPGGIFVGPMELGRHAGIDLGLDQRRRRIHGFLMC